MIAICLFAAEAIRNMKGNFLSIIKKTSKIRSLISSNEEKNIFDVLKFIFKFKIQILSGIILSIIISLLYILNLKNTYSSTFIIHPKFSYSLFNHYIPYYTSMTNIIANINNTINQKQFTEILSKYEGNVKNENVKLKLNYSDINYQFSFTIYSPIKLNNEKIIDIIKELNEKSTEYNNSIKNNIYNSFLSNSLNQKTSKNSVNNYLFTDDLINISIKMNSYIIKLVSKYKLNSELNYLNNVTFYNKRVQDPIKFSSKAKDLDLTPLFIQTLSYLINNNKIKYDEYYEFIKDFSTLKNNFDEKSMILDRVQNELSTRLLPYISVSKNQLIQENLLESKRSIQLLTAAFFIGFILSIIICYLFNFYKNTKIKPEDNH